MPKNADMARAEELAQGFARATLRAHWVVNRGGHFFAVPVPIVSSDLQKDSIKAWLPRIGTTVESEFDHTGKRIS